MIATAIIFAKITTYLLAFLITDKALGSLKNTFRDHRLTHQMLHLSFAYALAKALEGFVTSWCFFLNIPFPTSALVLLGLTSAASLIIGITRPNPPSLARYASAIYEVRWALPIYALGLVYCAWTLKYPWYDHDEIAFYGLMTKGISLGMTNDVNTWKGLIYDATVNVQTADALLFSLLGEPLWVRVDRLVGLLAVSVSLAGCLRLFNVSRSMAVVAASAVLLVPELNEYLALSLKVDSVVMVFEFHSLMLLAIAIFTRFYRDQDRTTLLEWSLLAMILALASFSARFSGAFPALTCFCWFLYLLGYQSNLSRAKALKYGGIGLAACLLIPHFMYFHLVDYGNPFFPLKFGSALGLEGDYIVDHATLKSRFNVNLPFPLAQLYFLLHASLGLKYWWVAPFIAEHHRASMNWMTPFLLILFLWPFLRGHTRMFKVLGTVLAGQFLLWSTGVHYTRTFMGPSLLAIVMFFLLIDSDERLKNPGGRRALFTVATAIMLILAIFPIHRETLRTYAINPLKFGQRERFEKIQIALREFQGEKGQMLSFDEKKQLNDMFAQQEKWVQAAYLKTGRARHVLFPNLVTDFQSLEDHARIHKLDLYQNPELVQKHVRHPDFLLATKDEMASLTIDAAASIKKLYSVPCFTSTTGNLVVLARSASLCSL